MIKMLASAFESSRLEIAIRNIVLGLIEVAGKYEWLILLRSDGLFNFLDANLIELGISGQMN